MSYASDLGINPDAAIQNFVNKKLAGGDLFIPSEIQFIKLAKDTFGTPRAAWKKAFEYLKYYMEKEKPMLIGLQELNRWFDYEYQMTESGVDGHYYTELPKKKEQRRTLRQMIGEDSYDSLGFIKKEGEHDEESKLWETINGNEPWNELRGVEKIVDMVEKIDNYGYFHDEVYAAFSKHIGSFSAMTIWDKNRLGTFVAGQVFSYKNPDDKVMDLSRPNTFVVTKNGGKYYLLINLHAPNNADYSMDDYTQIRMSIIKNYKKFMENFPEKSKEVKDFNNFDEIFMTGDFNDRFGGLLNGETKNLFRERVFKNDGYNQPPPENTVPNSSGVFNLYDEPPDSTRVLTFKFKDNFPLSCCYSWYSTWSEDWLQSLADFKYDPSKGYKYIQTTSENNTEGEQKLKETDMVNALKYFSWSEKKSAMTGNFPFEDFELDAEDSKNGYKYNPDLKKEINFLNKILSLTPDQKEKYLPLLEKRLRFAKGPLPANRGGIDKYYYIGDYVFSTLPGTLAVDQGTCNTPVPTGTSSLDQGTSSLDQGTSSLDQDKNTLGEGVTIPVVPLSDHQMVVFTLDEKLDEKFPVLVKQEVPVLVKQEVPVSVKQEVPVSREQGPDFTEEGGKSKLKRTRRTRRNKKVFTTTRRLRKGKSKRAKKSKYGRKTRK